MDLVCLSRCNYIHFHMSSIKRTFPLGFPWQTSDPFLFCVYHKDDYDEAMKLLDEGVVDCDSFITDIKSLDEIQGAFEALTTNPNAMKSMIRISEPA